MSTNDRGFYEEVAKFNHHQISTLFVLIRYINVEYLISARVFYKTFVTCLWGLPLLQTFGWNGPVNRKTNTLNTWSVLTLSSGFLAIMTKTSLPSYMDWLLSWNLDIETRDYTVFGANKRGVIKLQVPWLIGSFFAHISLKVFLTTRLISESNLWVMLVHILQFLL